MALNGWPSNLPQFVMEQGFSETLPSAKVESQMEAGPSKARPRYTTAPRIFTATVAMTPEQKEVFDAFYEDVLHFGTLEFDWVEPVSQSLAEFRFVNPPPKWSVRGGACLVSFAFMRKRRTTVIGGTVPVSGTANGVGVATATGRKIASASGTATGSGVAAATSANTSTTVSAAGTAAGVGNAAATGRRISAASGTATALGLASGVTGNTPAAPVLTQTSAAGTNPMSWDASYPGAIVDRDTVELNWRVNGGTWQSQTHTITGSDLISGGWTWSSYVAASSLFAASDVIDVRERVIRDQGTGSQATGNWSNTLTDTMATGAWSPLSLFGASEYGFFLDPANDTVVFQDAAGTTAAAVDQPVGLIRDGTTNDVDFSQSTSGARPIRKNVGGRWYLEFDGVDDLLKATQAGLYAAGQMTIMYAVQNTNTADVGVYVGERSSTDADPLYYPYTETSSGTNRRLWIKDDNATTIKNTSGSTPTPYDGNWNLFTAIDSGSSVVVENVTEGGTQANTGAGTSYVRSGTVSLNRTSIGGTTSTTDGNYKTMRIGRIVAIGRLLTTQEKADVKQWIASTSGITI